VGIRVAHNLVHDAPHAAILLSGNENVIEYNHIHHVCWETGDVGAIYIGRDWTQRGNVVRHNYFHHTQGVGMGSMAVYLDDCASGTTVFGNVFRGCTRAVFLGGGRDNRVENNIFIECEPAVMIDGRGLDPSPVWRRMVNETMKARLDEMNPRFPPYSERYPELGKLDRYYATGEGVPPEGNTVARNISIGGQWLTIHWKAEPEMIDVHDNLVGDDPVIVDSGGLHLRLTKESAALGLGFRRIPFEMIGRYQDEYGRNEVDE
jgi:parallel beta-helix repeat protein